MNDEVETQDVPPGPGATEQRAGTPEPVRTPSAGDEAPSVGGRQVFRNLRRQITDDELQSPGVQKLLINMLEESENECDKLRGYVERFHDADKRASVLDERQRSYTAMEIIFAVGVGLGGTIVGFAPFLWSKPPQGHIALALGMVLVIGSGIARVVKR